MKLLKKMRMDKSLTIDDIAEYVGVSNSTVSRWETGKIEAIKNENLEKLAEILGVNVDEINANKRDNIVSLDNKKNKIRQMIDYLNYDEIDSLYVIVKKLCNNYA